MPIVVFSKLIGSYHLTCSIPGLLRRHICCRKNVFVASTLSRLDIVTLKLECTVVPPIVSAGLPVEAYAAYALLIQFTYEECLF